MFYFSFRALPFLGSQVEFSSLSLSLFFFFFGLLIFVKFCCFIVQLLLLLLAECWLSQEGSRGSKGKARIFIRLEFKSWVYGFGLVFNLLEPDSRGAIWGMKIAENM